MRQPKQGNETQNNSHNPVDWAVVFVGVHALGWLPLSRKPGTIGRFTLGLAAWLNVLFVYLAYVSMWPPDTAWRAHNAYRLWVVLTGLLAFQTFCAWFSPVRRHSKEIGRFFLRRAEPLYAMALIYGGMYFCGLGVGLYFIACVLCHAIQLQMIRARSNRVFELIDDQRYEAEEIQTYLR